MQQRQSISVTLITLNEAGNVGDCLESVAWADEIIILDSGSTDGTPDICRKYTDRVYVTDWPGYGPQKNRALDYATGDWVLSIDADERVTDELRREIEQAAGAAGHDAYSIPRSSSYCGRFLRHGGWWPDRVIRLFRRDKARFSDSIVHETVVVDGSVGQLCSPLLHYTYRTLDDVVSMINRYSSASAEAMYRAGKRGGLGRAIGHGAWVFLRTYVLRLGLLDGREGFMLAVSNAELAYYKYLKLAGLHKAAAKEQ
ncbi:MAG: glycosyltransferase family 2 protein [Gammaproteobacteria bacterium]